MRKQLHLTRRQWLGLGKWSVYALLYLLLLLFQSVVSAQWPLFGIKANFLPLVCVCLCMKEGPEKGGLFSLIATTAHYFSGADYGNLQIFVVTAGGVLSGLACRSLLPNRFWPGAVCALCTLLANALVIWLFKMTLAGVTLSALWQVLLPEVGLSLLAYPAVYGLVRVIGKIGGDYGV